LVTFAHDETTADGEPHFPCQQAPFGIKRVERHGIGMALVGRDLIENDVSRKVERDGSTIQKLQTACLLDLGEKSFCVIGIEVGRHAASESKKKRLIGGMPSACPGQRTVGRCAEACDL